MIELSPAVWKESEFAERNKGHLVHPDYPCLYVEKTSCLPEERFEQHMSGVHASRKVTKCGVRLRPEFCECLNPMTSEDTEDEERELAEVLMRAGYAVWWN